jgi:predicted RND superfamily exporter protein
MLDFLLTTEMQSRFARRIAQRHRWVILVACALTVFSLFGALRLHINSDMIALLPQNSRSVVELRELTNKIGGTGDIQILITSPDSQRSVDYAESILPSIRSLPWVENANVGNDTRFFDEHKLLYVDLKDLVTIESRVKERVRYETLRAQPLYIDLEEEPEPSLDFSDIEEKYRSKGPRSPYFRNESGSILLILVQPKGTASDIAHARRVQRDIWEFLDQTDPAGFHPAMTVEVGGAYRNRINEIDTIAKDVRSSLLVVGLAIILLTSFPACRRTGHHTTHQLLLSTGAGRPANRGTPCHESVLDLLTGLPAHW